MKKIVSLLLCLCLLMANAGTISAYNDYTGSYGGLSIESRIMEVRISNFRTLPRKRQQP